MKFSTIQRFTKLTPYLFSAASLLIISQFLYHANKGVFNIPFTLGILFTVSISMLVIIGLRGEFDIIKNTKLNRDDYQLSTLLKSGAVVFLTTLGAHYFASIFGTSTIFAAGLVCVISTYLFPNYQAEAYSGTVSGMIGVYLCEHWSVALLTGVGTIFFYQMFKPYFKGVGGRGGTISYSASIFIVRALLRIETNPRPLIEREFLIPSLIMIILITFLTYYLHVNNITTVVRSAMIIAVVFAILIPNEFTSLKTAMFAGTVLGMSTKDRVSNYKQLTLICIVGFILYVPSFHMLDGIGGKLGMLSLVSFYGAEGFNIVTNILKRKLFYPIRKLEL